jgi:hypothetical protein
MEKQERRALKGKALEPRDLDRELGALAAGENSDARR